MSSHREAPEISKDPVADNTDVYAFVSPDDPETVTIIANYIPLEGPDAGPNFFEFGDDVMYNIYVDNDGDGLPDVTYQFRFHTHVRNPETFLYNVGPIKSDSDPNWNRYQWYSLTRIARGKSEVIGQHLTCPPCNIGPRSTPNYSKLAEEAVHHLSTGESVFAGQRREGFYVDLGAIFDLATLRPFENLHRFPSKAEPGVDSLTSVNVHSIAIRIPKKTLTSDGSNPTNAASPRSVIGVWASADRRKSTIREANGTLAHAGPFVQVSRLGNPLINEVIIPMGLKDAWNATSPSKDKKFLKYYQHPEVGGLLPYLYPDVFPNLAKLKAARADLVAILLTGLPSGIVKGFQNYTGSTMSDQLRLNMAIKPTTKDPSAYGLLGGDPAGFPNGRRVFDDVVTIELRAIAGLTYALVDPKYKPDGAAGLDLRCDPAACQPVHVALPLPGRSPQRLQRSEGRINQIRKEGRIAAGPPSAQFETGGGNRCTSIMSIEYILKVSSSTLGTMSAPSSSTPIRSCAVGRLKSAQEASQRESTSKCWSD